MVNDEVVLDAERFAWMLRDPETARHLLRLLMEKKGNEESLRKMIDRIQESKVNHLRNRGTSE